MTFGEWRYKDDPGAASRERHSGVLLPGPEIEAEARVVLWQESETELQSDFGAGQPRGQEREPSRHMAWSGAWCHAWSQLEERQGGKR
ncbi:hypothetical protein [Paenibacillus sp. y28]|uniref:hypothetical protein n=1 Tax=Paenibacillus sp. y28 TaxID=3129110 RepID=UPI0030198856